MYTIFQVTKRACSAPPVDMGKVVLQRMELKSPVTIRQPSVVPFEQQPQQQPAHQSIPIQYYPSNRAQTPLILNRQYVQPSPALINQNQRAVLKSTSLNRNGFNQLDQMQKQTTPQRNVYLNRTYSERPVVNGRNGNVPVMYTNGYETDSALSYNNNPTTVMNGNYRTLNQPYVQQQQNNRMYRQVVPGSSTLPRNYNLNEHQQQNGYETDSGLVKLRHVLDNQQQLRSTPLQTMPNGYNYNNSNSNRGFLGTPAFQIPIENLTARAENLNDGIQYIDSVVPPSGYLSPDATQIVIQESMPNNQHQPQQQQVVMPISQSTQNFPPTLNYKEDLNSNSNSSNNVNNNNNNTSNQDSSLPGK
jgi:hypothetical protein